MMHPKPTKIRSKKLTRAAQDERCALRISPDCDDYKTVVFCHAPSVGKGWASKSDDWWGADACLHCHKMADRGEITDDDWLRAIYETLKRRFERGILKVEE